MIQSVGIILARCNFFNLEKLWERCGTPVVSMVSYMLVGKTIYFIKATAMRGAETLSSLSIVVHELSNLRLPVFVLKRTVRAFHCVHKNL